MKSHHNGLFTNPPNRKHRFGHIAYVDLIDVDYFCIHEYVGMLDTLGLGDSTLFSHFRILGKYFDDGLVPLMTVEYVVQMFK